MIQMITTMYAFKSPIKFIVETFSSRPTSRLGYTIAGYSMHRQTQTVIKLFYILLTL